MANYATKFVDPAGNYTGGYTSNIIKTNNNNNSNSLSGIFQVSITTGTIELSMRLSPDAPWFLVETFTDSNIREVTLANEMKVEASAAAVCWIAEVL